MESRAIFGVCTMVTLVNSWLACDRAYEAMLAKRIVNPSPFEVLDGTYRVWGVLFAVLGAGCLLWERRHGGAAFSLGLPVRLAHFNLIRAAVGFVEVAFVGSVPTFAAGSLHQLIRPELQLPVIPAFTLAGIALGFSSFALAYFFSAFQRNLYISMIVGWIAAVATSVALTEFPLTSQFGGMRLLRHLGSLPPKPVDWNAVCLYTAIGIVLVVAGAYISEHRSHLEVR